MGLFDRLRAYAARETAVAKQDAAPVAAQAARDARDDAPPTIHELARNYPGVYMQWPTTARSYNPQDDLIGRRGMEIYERMRRDDAVKGAMRFKKAAVLSPGWEIRPASDKRKDTQIADFITHVLTTLDPLYGAFDDIMTEQLTALDFGFSIGELVLKKLDEGEYKGKVGLKTIKVRRPHDFMFDVDEFDNLKENGILQVMNEKGMPVKKFLIYTYQREFGNFKGVSDLRSAYEPWWLKSNLWRWAGIYAERYAIPIPVGKYPAGHKNLLEIQAFQDMLARIQANTSMTFPDNFDLVLQEAGGRGVNVLQWLFEECNLAIARAILVPSKLGLTAEPGTGTYSQARKHFDAFMLVIDELQHDLANDVMNGQLIPRLVAWNFANVEKLPEFRWLPIPDEQLASLMTSWMQAVAMGLVKSTPQDEVYIRKATSFPDREISDDEEAAAAKKIEADVAKTDAEAEAVLANPEGVGPMEDLTGGGGQDMWGGQQGATGGAGAWSPGGAEPGAASEEDENAPLTFAAVQIPRIHTAHYAQALHAHERKLDYAAIANGLDTVETEVVARMTEILTRSQDAALAVVQKKIESGALTFEFARDFDLKYRAEMTRVVREALDSAYRQGSTHGSASLARVTQHARRTPNTPYGMPGEQALKYFDEKSFWVTGVVKQQLNDKLKNVIMNAIKTGQPLPVTMEQMRAAFEPYLGNSRALRAGKREQATPYRIETIIRTNMTDAWNQGMKQSQASNIESGYVIAWRSVAILDARTTDLCEKLHGQYFKPVSEETELLFPPRHFNCRSLFVPVTKDEGPVKYISRAKTAWALAQMDEGFGGRP